MVPRIHATEKEHSSRIHKATYPGDSGQLLKCVQPGGPQIEDYPSEARERDLAADLEGTESAVLQSSFPPVQEGSKPLLVPRSWLASKSRSFETFVPLVDPETDKEFLHLLASTPEPPPPIVTIDYFDTARLGKLQPGEIPGRSISLNSMKSDVSRRSILIDGPESRCASQAKWQNQEKRVTFGSKVGGIVEVRAYVEAERQRSPPSLSTMLSLAGGCPR